MGFCACRDQSMVVYVYVYGVGVGVYAGVIGWLVGGWMGFCACRVTMCVGGGGGCGWMSLCVWGGCGYVRSGVND